MVPGSITMRDESNLARKGRRRVTPADRGEAVPAGGAVTPAPGRLRAKTPGRHYDRSAGQPAALGRPGMGNTRPSLVPSQEARELELSGGVPLSFYFRHPEVAAKRPSKGDGPGRASFEARSARASG